MAPLEHSLRKALRRGFRGRPAIKRALLDAELGLGLIKHEIGLRVPQVIRAKSRKLTVAITAACNQRCMGCRYGRDFMPGHELSLEMMRQLLDDAAAAGVETVRIYGGEPLLHRDLPAMVRHAVDLGLSTYLTTNGLLLGAKIDDLYDAGLRSVTIGFYGMGAAYDRYVGARGNHRQLEESLAAVRDRYGDAVGLQLNYLIMRPSATVAALDDAWGFAQRWNMSFHTDLIHDALPYFTDGSDPELQMTAAERPALQEVVDALVRLKRLHPEKIPESERSLRSIPEWLYRDSGLKVPCDAYKLIWVGADGTVQLCYVTFKLGNLHERRLAEMLYTPAHHGAARDAFALKCPNCHCERNHRVSRHLASRRRYR
ncbi:MAG: radical SAM protein [Planctomycetota bacterium]